MFSVVEEVAKEKALVEEVEEGGLKVWFCYLVEDVDGEVEDKGQIFLGFKDWGVVDDQAVLDCIEGSNDIRIDFADGGVTVLFDVGSEVELYFLEEGGDPVVDFLKLIGVGFEEE